MRAVIQAVSSASVRVNGGEPRAIGPGLVILLGVRDLGYSALVVSQFTLYGDTKKGFRPSFIHAAKAPLAVDAYEMFLAEMGRQGLKEVRHGEFGADMQVALVNEGPCTIVIDTDEWKKKE